MTGKARILIVEDEKDWREVLFEMLEGAGYVVEVAEDYASASRQICNADFHVAVVDLNLTDVADNRDGERVLEALHKFSKDTKAIIVSGAGETDSTRAKSEYGAIAYIPKPDFDPEEFLDIVAEQWLMIREANPVVILLRKGDEPWEIGTKGKRGIREESHA